MSNPILVIDADPVVYRSAFSAQTSTFDYVYETAAGEVKHRIWDDGRKAQKFFRRYPKLTILSKDKHVDPLPVEKALAAAKQVLNDTVVAAKRRFKSDVDVQLVLSGPGNFRKDIATIKPYKGERPPPPIHYQAVRDYLTHYWDAEVIHGWEADDECSIRVKRANREGIPAILATIDKDLDQVPGTHYCYRQHVFYEVGDYEAELFFWQQVLSGDSTDNIQGCYKIGEGKAKKLIEEWEPLSAEFLWEQAVATYAETMFKYPDKYPDGMTAEEAALETARLVHMMDYEGQLWTAPGEADGTLPNS